MAQSFVPLTLELVEEGAFLRDADKELAALQAKLVSFARQHGDKAKKAKGELTIKIAVECLDPGEGQFSITSSLTHKTPARPVSVSLAIADVTGDDAGDDSLSLFVRKSGSDKSLPHQSKLCTDDGEAIVGGTRASDAAPEHGGGEGAQPDGSKVEPPNAE